MKITIEHCGNKIAIETEDDEIAIYELVDHLYGLCVATGYHADSVAGAFMDKGCDLSEVRESRDELPDPAVQNWLSVDIEPFDGLLRDDINNKG